MHGSAAFAWFSSRAESGASAPSPLTEPAACAQELAVSQFAVAKSVQNDSARVDLQFWDQFGPQISREAASFCAFPRTRVQMVCANTIVRLHPYWLRAQRDSQADLRRTRPQTTIHYNPGTEVSLRWHLSNCADPELAKLYDLNLRSCLQSTFESSFLRNNSTFSIADTQASSRRCFEGTKIQPPTTMSVISNHRLNEIHQALRLPEDTTLVIRTDLHFNASNTCSSAPTNTPNRTTSPCQVCLNERAVNPGSDMSYRLNPTIAGQTTFLSRLAAFTDFREQQTENGGRITSVGNRSVRLRNFRMSEDGSFISFHLHPSSELVQFLRHNSTGSNSDNSDSDRPDEVFPFQTVQCRTDQLAEALSSDQTRASVETIRQRIETMFTESGMRLVLPSTQTR